MKDGAPGVMSVRSKVVKEEAAVVDRGLKLVGSVPILRGRCEVKSMVLSREEFMTRYLTAVRFDVPLECSQHNMMRPASIYQRFMGLKNPKRIAPFQSLPLLTVLL